MKTNIAQCEVFPDFGAMTRLELEEFILASLHEMSLSAERIEMMKETRNSIQEAIAQIEARLPRELSS